MPIITRREFWLLVPAGLFALRRSLAAGSALRPDDAPPEDLPGYDTARALARDREAAHRLYTHLLGYGTEGPGKGALIGWHAAAWPDPVLAGTPAGAAQLQAGEAGRKQWEEFLAATGGIGGKAVNRWLRRLPGVVYLEGAGLPAGPPPELHPIVEHRNMEIHPTLLPIQQGSTVDFINRDECRDNIMSESATARFSHWFTGADQLRLQEFPRAGVVPLLCKVHPDEWGTILVAPTPFFALTGPGGEFTLPRIPPGKWRLRFWHPKLRPAEQEVAVQAGRTATAVFQDLKGL